MGFAPGDRLQRTTDLPFQKIIDKILVVAPRARKAHLLEGCGADAWELLSVPMTVDELTAKIEETYDASAETIRTDLLAFLETLSTQELVKIVPAR